MKISPENLRMGIVNTNAIPFKWQNSDGGYEGPIIDIIKHLGAEYDIDIEIVPLPIPRLLKAIEVGSLDGMLGLTRNTSREQIAVFLDEPIGAATLHVFVMKGSEFPFTNVKDLYKLRVGVLRGLSYGRVFDKAVEDKNIESFDANSWLTLIKMLSNRRVDAVCAPTNVFNNLLKQQEMEKTIFQLPHPIMEATTDIYILFSKLSEFDNKNHIISSFNNDLKEMINNGVIDDIYLKYGYQYITSKKQ